jgi:hypothetical protein
VSLRHPAYDNFDTVRLKQPSQGRYGLRSTGYRTKPTRRHDFNVPQPDLSSMLNHRSVFKKHDDRLQRRIGKLLKEVLEELLRSTACLTDRH